MSEVDSALDPIARLSFEHRQIDRVLVALSEMIVRISGGANADHAFFAQLVEFIEHFADGSHHLKEERVLFEEVWAQGFARTGPLACMMSQHDLARELTRTVKDWVESDGRARAAGLNEMLSAAGHYSNLLWTHIATEDRLIFPAIRRSLSPASLAHVLAGYGQVDPSPPEQFRAAADAVVQIAAAASVETACPAQARAQ